MRRLMPTIIALPSMACTVFVVTYQVFSNHGQAAGCTDDRFDI